MIYKLSNLEKGARINTQIKGITFIRQGLAKQDRPNHYRTKIFVPAFAENKLLDPKRCLYFFFL